MKAFLFKIFTLFTLCILLLNVQSQAQVVNDDDSTELVDEDYIPVSQKANTVSGRWYGIGNVVTDRNTNSYLCELIITEKKGGLVTGFFNYFFRDGYFSVRLKGSYKKDAQQFKFNPLIVLFHQTTKASIGVDVAMSGNFFLNVLKNDTALTGFLMPTKNDRYLVPPINVKFTKLPKNAPSLKQRIKDKPLLLEGTEDEIRRIANGENIHDEDHSLTFKDKETHFGKDSLHFNNSNNTSKLSDKLTFKENKQEQYQNDSLHFDKNNLSNNPYQNDSLRFAKNNGVTNHQGDSLFFKKAKNNTQRDSLHFEKKQNAIQPNIVIQQNTTIEKQLVDLYKSRKNNIAKDFVVKDDSVTVQLYDNGEYDKDVVSVFFNGKIIAAHKELSTRIPIKFVVHLSKGDPKKNELTLFADNLGEIPPNSALMIVTDTKGTRYEVNLDSDFSKNASILLKVQD
ncbi:hypothetical protein [Rhizosphaericola mali]|uniref:Uncharacterized protein n=1 Tax=Rhizosphaericola mali TaxID=2545455 RepID=A0A5P2G2Z6_9BACT|nr:hypothetical protein [Rhizosphaericola mali]QES88180.1 hypothetical protein E0W69_005695 [Rhizosphaericola mali]